MYILGISAYYHDSAAALLHDGRILAAAQEERFTRKKHDPGFPSHAIRYCLAEAGLEPGQVDLVGFYDKPFLKFERLLESYVGYAPRGFRSFAQAMPLWLKQKLWMRDMIHSQVDCRCEVLFCEHHESHAASAFYPSPYEEAAILTIDGVGEWTTTSYGIGRGNQVDLLGEIQFPHSLGLLYSAFTYYTGFRVNSGEYKVMGLAPYGEPKYVDLILEKLVDMKPDGSFKLNQKYFKYVYGLSMTNRRFHNLFGRPPRRPESKVTQHEMDVARSVQVVVEESMLRMARFVHEETGGQKYLCLAGGVALNCVANGRIQREGPFEDVWIQPAAGDAGGALGVAMYLWHRYLGKPREADGQEDQMQAAMVGPQFGDPAIERFLEKRGAEATRLDEDELPGRVGDLLASENVVGWFQDRMEFGPRALGGRSIIGDARCPKMQRKMNLKIKFRESFRPFAPSVLLERCPDYFEMDCTSPYMLKVAPVREDRRRQMTDDEQKLWGIEKLNALRSDVPAITHVDYSARVQTVREKDHSRYYRMIKAFEDKTGCGCIINTSFNVRGEPIVCTPHDAFQCFMRTEMDYLMMGSYLLDKNKQKPLEDDVDWRKQFTLD